jgi:hypothetical protein
MSVSESTGGWETPTMAREIHSLTLVATGFVRIVA